MTTIATDGKSLASDGLETAGDVVVGWNATKLYRLKDGSIIGCAGEASHVYDFIDWLEDDNADYQAFKKVQAIRLYSNGLLEIYEGRRFMPIEAPAAVGSGWVHAMTAMDMGASPSQAIEMAAKRDVHTGGNIQIMLLE